MEYLPIIANLEGVPAHRAGTGNKQKKKTTVTVQRFLMERRNEN